MKKKVFILSVLTALLFTVTNAQTPYATFSGDINSIPSELTVNGHPIAYLVHSDNGYIDDINSVDILDGNLSMLNSYYISINEAPTYLNIDVGYNVQLNKRLYLTQTLFNSDTNYEYLYVEYGSLNTPDYTYDGALVYVMSTNGEIINTINIVESIYGYVYAEIVKFNNRYYLTLRFKPNQGNLELTYLYLIDRSTQSINRVEGDMLMNVFPSVADRSQTITVELGEGNNATEIQVVNALGQVVKSIPVQPGQREVQIRAGDFQSGLHIVGARSREGQSTCKIIVK